MAAGRVMAMGGLLLALLGACTGPGVIPDRVEVVVRGETFDLAFAGDESSRRRGLQGVANIRPDGGMLFIFPDERLRFFWMSGCITDIDLLFLDRRGTVTAVHRMTTEAPRGPDESELDYNRRLQSYPSVRAARYAIELAPGTLDRLGVRPDDRVELDHDRLYAWTR